MECRVSNGRNGASVACAVLIALGGCRQPGKGDGTTPAETPLPARVPVALAQDSWVCGTRITGPVVRSTAQLRSLADKADAQGSPLRGAGEAKLRQLYETQQSIDLARLHKGLGPTREIRVWVIKKDKDKDPLLRTWLEGWTHTGLFTFKFVDGPPAEVRIRYEIYRWESVIGDELGLTDEAPTMYLGIDPTFTATSEDAQRTALLHEFGHALGMYHELSTPGSVLKLDHAKVIAYFAAPPFNQTEGWVVKNVLTPLSASARTFAFDRQSIMIYPLPAELTTDGRPVLPPGGISPNDVSTLKKAYGSSPALQ